MNILFITQYFSPEEFRGNDVAFYLAQQGHQVHVISGIPNYPKGEFFPGYGYFKKKHEKINGVYITRIVNSPRGKNAISLMLNYFSYMINAWFYILFHSITHKYDCVFVQQLSPVMMSVPGILYKRLRHVPLYTWVLDLWPESLRSAGGINNKYILKFFAHFSANEYRWSDKILISSNSFRNSIIQYGDYGNKIIYFPQWAEDSILSADFNVQVPILPRGFKIMFAGSVGEAQDFDHIMEAAKLTRGHKDIKWVIVGDGRKLEWVTEYVEKNNISDTVLILGRYPIDSMAALFAQADVMLVSLKDTDIFRLTAPAKIQAYMASSKPIVSMLNGEGADVIKDADCGYNVSAEDSESLANTIITLSGCPVEELEEKGRNGYNYYKQHYDKNKCLKNLLNILKC
jgi:glycosyltransferase involved in cell wall biosynthesis